MRLPLLLFAFLSCAQAQKPVLYLLSARPNPVGSSPDSKLYVVKEESTSPILFEKLLSEEAELDQVHISYEGQVITLIAQNRLLILPMGEPAQILEVPIDAQKRHAHRTPILESPGKGFLQGLHFIGRSLIQDQPLTSPRERDEFAGVYLSGPLFGQRVSLSFEEYAHIRISGAPGGALRRDAAFFGAVGGNLEVREGPLDVKEIVIADGSVPSVIPVNSKLDVEFVTKDFICIAVPVTRAVSQRQSGSSVLHIYNRKESIWSKLLLAGDAPEVRPLEGHWIGIIEAEATERQATPPQKRPGEPLGPSLAFRDSPGLSPKEETESETRAKVRDWYRRKAYAYQPGRLTVYNLKSKAKFQIETGEGDSEVLFANDAAVYYRAFDKIFKCEILGDSLSSPSLIANGPDMVNVHWAFIGPAVN